MNYYNEIKNELINNEVYKKVKDYSKNRSDLKTYYNVGKLLSEAGKHYGDGIIKKYSEKLIIDIGKKYNERTLRRIRQYYNKFKDSKWSSLRTKLSWTHYKELLSINGDKKIQYYINISYNQNLSVRELILKIKNKEYDRLPKETKIKLIENKFENKVQDFIKNPILIKNRYCTTDNISEKMLQKLVLEDIPSFLKELGSGFSFIENEYKIKIGARYNYIDLLLFNIIFDCYVVIELKVTELRKEHIGQIEAYMNYIDKNIKKLSQEKTIGIIICKKDNRFVMEYCSDNRIFSSEYVLN